MHMVICYGRMCFIINLAIIEPVNKATTHAAQFYSESPANTLVLPNNTPYTIVELTQFKMATKKRGEKRGKKA